MSDANTPTPPRVPRWVKVLLGISLALNLLVIGLASGAAWRFAKNGPPDAVRSGFAFVGALEKADRRAILGELRESGRNARRAGREDMQRVLDLLRAPDTDIAALDELMRAQVMRGRQIQDDVRTAVLDQITDMDAQERAAYADRLEERLKKGRRKPGKRDAASQ